jgi:hypothetical protein
MKKRKKTPELDFVPIQNPVAKFAAQFNKAATFKDKTKYNRNSKGNKQEAWSIIPGRVIDQASCLMI